jgi:hypothetical protein
VIPQNADSFGWCSASAFEDASNCSSFLDVSALTAKITKDCEGQKACLITDLRSYMPADETV